MIGKASEIKFQHVYDRQTRFEEQMELWNLSNPNAEVIRVEFSTNYDHSDSATLVHALIIYKEANTHE
ncbi:hypothetical protein V3851_04435 [Paenibacillus sp. M1]|uniref:Sporulation protein Cse60 n=1 Tax=Paenibacillus haidiansis TaxID=1574488 RepID=A0ABU7VNN1_9BACL